MPAQIMDVWLPSLKVAVLALGFLGGVIRLSAFKLLWEPITGSGRSQLLCQMLLLDECTEFSITSSKLGIPCIGPEMGWSLQDVLAAGAHCSRAVGCGADAGSGWVQVAVQDAVRDAVQKQAVAGCRMQCRMQCRMLCRCRQWLGAGCSVGCCLDAGSG